VKLSSQHIWMIGVSLVWLALGIRVVSVAAYSETGWEVLSGTWLEATIGRLGYSHHPIQNQDAAEQAQFWLAEAERICDGEVPPTADILMGAAWVLDSPVFGNGAKYVRPEQGVFELGPQLDVASMERAAAEFERQCRDACTRYAARATELEPQNREWWRMRALLLFDRSSFGAQFKPRTANWAAVLKDSSKHDPNNALYDYLAALCYWIMSGEFDDGGGVNIHEQGPFEQGTEHYQRGLREEQLLFGTGCFPALAEFLTLSSVSMTEAAEVAGHSSIENIATVPLVKLLRWQIAVADEYRSTNDVAGAVGVLRRFLRVPGQVLRSGEPAGQRGSAEFCRIIAFRRFERLVDDVNITAEELAQLTEQHVNDRVKRKVLQAVNQKLDLPTGNQTLQSSGVPTGLTNAGLAVSTGLTQASAVLLLPIGLVGWCIATWLLKRHEAQEIPLGPLRHVMSWILGFGVVFVVFGLAPARVVSLELQEWIVYALGWSPLVCMLAWTAVTGARITHSYLGRVQERPIRSLLLVISIWLFAILFLPILWGAWESRARESILFKTIADRRVMFSALLLSVPFIAFWMLRIRRSIRKTGHVPLQNTGVLGFLVLCTVAVMPVLRIYNASLSEAVSGLAVPARGVDGWSPEELKLALELNRGEWEWVFFQWSAYPTVQSSLGAALCFVAVWYMCRSVRHSAQGLKYWISGPRSNWGGLLACVSRSALCAAACFLTIYLAAAPGLLRSVEAHYEPQISYFRDPSDHWETVNEMVERLEGQPHMMQQFRDEVQDDIVSGDL